MIVSLLSELRCDFLVSFSILLVDSSNCSVFLRCASSCFTDCAVTGLIVPSNKIKIRTFENNGRNMAN